MLRGGILAIGIIFRSQAIAATIFVAGTSPVA
jgi:hypothetical protein